MSTPIPLTEHLNDMDNICLPTLATDQDLCIFLALWQHANQQMTVYLSIESSPQSRLDRRGREDGDVVGCTETRVCLWFADERAWWEIHAMIQLGQSWK